MATKNESIYNNRKRETCEYVFNRILADRTEELPGLADDLLATILMLDVDTHRVSAG
jgi:hypothetical protein